MRTRRSWAGTAWVGDGRAVYLGPARDTAAHAHHAVQVCVALGAAVRLRAGDGPWRTYAAAVVASDRTHALDGRGEAVLLVYVEPEGAEGRALQAACGGSGIRAVPQARAAALRAAALGAAAHRGSPDPAELCATVLRALGGGQPAPAPLDPRIEAALAHVARERDAVPPGAVIARAVGLSATRFRHLFASQIGLPYRRYRLWRRLALAGRALADGASLTRAAHDAGFADAAHMTRTFRRTLGVPPSVLAGVRPLEP